MFGIDRYSVYARLKFPAFGLYLKFGLYRILLYTGFCLDRVVFIQGSVLYRVLFYTGFCLDRFIQGSV